MHQPNAIELLMAGITDVGVVAIELMSKIEGYIPVQEKYPPRET
jgi:hypothetical protein